MASPEEDAKPAVEKAEEPSTTPAEVASSTVADSTEKVVEDDGGVTEILAKIAKLKDPEPGLHNVAISRIRHRLRAKPEDAALLHNLGVVYSEMGRWEEAEDSFLSAAESMKKDNKASDATMYGLATSMTEQNTPPKLMQAEAILRDLLDRAISLHEKGIAQGVAGMYRAYITLANNLELQKRWAEAAEAWRAGVMIGANMFGENCDGISAQRLALTRAERLARWQRIFRVVVWSITIGLPVGVSYYFGKFDRAWEWLGYTPANDTAL